MEHHTIQVQNGIELRPVSHSHSSELFKLIKANQSYLSVWLEWTSSLSTESDMASFIDACVSQYTSGTGYVYCIFLNGSIVGVVGFKDVTKSGECELGCWLSEHAQGQGIMTSAIRALNECGLSNLGLSRIKAYVAQGNVKSRSVCERVGFVKTGALIQTLHNEDIVHDVFEITN